VRPDRAVQEGEFLIAVDGREIRPPENPYRYLQVTRGQKVSITVGSKPASEGARRSTWSPSARSRRCATTVLADNIEAVRSASNGDLGYMHITAMSTDNIGQFDKFWRAFRYKKGIVIDVRGNGGRLDGVLHHRQARARDVAFTRCAASSRSGTPAPRPPGRSPC